MTRFSASDAALEGFRLTRERPGTVLAWAGVYCAGLLLIGAIMLGLVGPDLVKLTKDGGLNDPDKAAEVLVHSAPAFIALLVLAVALMSVLTAGIYRIILRPQEKGFVHLRLGMDELRLVIVNLVLFSVGVACVVTALTLARLAAAAGPAVEGLVVILVMSFAGWVGVRLSMTTPMTFVLQRVSVKEAWLLSRGAFWPLLGMMVLAVIFYVMVWILITIMGTAFVAAAGGQEAMADPTHLSPLAVVAMLVSFLLQLVLSVLQVVMIYAPFAVAYEQLHGDLSVDPLRRTPRAQTP
jgi:hypothetical protein